jgi:hypothetical protein
MLAWRRACTRPSRGRSPATERSGTVQDTTEAIIPAAVSRLTRRLAELTTITPAGLYIFPSVLLPAAFRRSYSGTKFEASVTVQAAPPRPISPQPAGT